MKGIEPSQPAWKAGALPLSYTRISALAAVKNVIAAQAFTLLISDIEQSSCQNISSFGGDERIRTTESKANGFTVRPIWPTLEHPHNIIYYSSL